MLALSRVAAAARHATRRLPRLLHTSVPLRERATRRSQLLAKELTKAGSISELVRMHTDYRAGIGHVHMPTLWHKLSVLSRRSEERLWLKKHTPQLASLCDHTVELLPEIGTSGLASTTSSVASLARIGFEQWSARRQRTGCTCLRSEAREGRFPADATPA